MPSFYYQEKNKTRISEKKQIRALFFQNVAIESLGLFFFTELFFVVTQRVKYRKKVTLGTGSNVNGTQP